jgi:nucleoside-diphosphate-sugar epimerase
MVVKKIKLEIKRFFRLNSRSGSRKQAWVKEQTAWAVNVFGTQNIVEACKKSK